MGCIPAPREKTTVNTTVMKEKTPEEKKIAVLAFCEQVCPHLGHYHRLNGLISIVAYMDHESVGYSIHRQTVENGVGHRLATIGDGIPASSDDWWIAYRLLGLEARELREKLQAEKAASAKLVEDLEDACSKGLSYAPHLVKRVEDAIEAHKKGGTQG